MSGKREISNGVKKVFLIFSLSLLLITVFVPAPASAGLVPCGLSVDDPNQPGDQTEDCTLCHFFVMIDNWLDGLLLLIVPVLAALMIAIGGVYYIISQGNTEKLTKAKGIFTAVAIGLFIIYGAWLMINLFLMTIGVTHWDRVGGNWWEINCQITNQSSSGGTTSNGGIPPSGGNPPNVVTAPQFPVIGVVGDIANISACLMQNGDELRVDVRVTNTGLARRYYTVTLLTSGNVIVDEKNRYISMSETDAIRVSTEWNIRADVGTLGGSYIIELEEQSQGSTSNPRVSMPIPTIACPSGGNPPITTPPTTTPPVIPPQYSSDPYGELLVSSCISGSNLIITATVNNPISISVYETARNYEIVLSVGSTEVAKNIIQFLPPDGTQTVTFSEGMGNNYNIALFETDDMGTRIMTTGTIGTPAVEAPAVSQENIDLVGTINDCP